MGIPNIIKHIRGYGDDPNSKRKIPFWTLWYRYFIDKKTAYKSDMFQTRPTNQYTNGTFIYSGGDKVSVYYSIDKYPSTLPKDYKTILRNSVSNMKDVRISFIDSYTGHGIDWNAPNMKSKLRNWENIDEEEEGTMNTYNMHEKFHGYEARSHRADSIEYWSQLDYRQRRIYTVRTLMIITGNRGNVFDKAVSTVMSASANMGLQIMRIEEDVGTFLEAFSPFSHTMSSSTLREVGNPDMSDEILAQTYVYSQGKIGEKGKYWGMDVDSGFPVFKEIKEDPKDPENILITGQTGSGKSFFAKAMILQMLCDDRFLGTIMDYEGTEYEPLMNFVQSGESDPKSVVAIEMGVGSGVYFDPVPICEINVLDADKGVFTDENNPYSMSKSYTESLLYVICCRGQQPTGEEESIIQLAINRMYREAGVNMNPSTWRKSQSLTIKDVHRQIEKLFIEYQTVLNKNKRGETLTPQESALLYDKYKNALNKIYRQSIDNLKNDMNNCFKKPIKLEEIIKAKLVVCKFNMLGKSPDTVSPLQMAMLSNTAAIISHIRSLYSRAQHKLNYKVWEEFQRWSDLPGSVSTIRVALTGGRKLGDVNIIITNDIKSILLKDDFALVGNMTTMCIGLIGDNETRDLIIDQWPELQEMRGQLDSIAATAESRSKAKGRGGKYDKAFLLYLDRKVSTVTHMTLQDGLAKSIIFKTAVEIDENTNKKGDRV